jgi:hypothetical protein
MSVWPWNGPYGSPIETSLPQTFALSTTVVPAKAGTQESGETRDWIPASAGMTAGCPCKPEKYFGNSQRNLRNELPAMDRRHYFSTQKLHPKHRHLPDTVKHLKESLLTSTL